MSLTKEQILGINDAKIEEVKVPEWGGTVFVRMMTGRARDAYERTMYEKAKLGNMGENARAHLLALTVCNEAGELIFTPADIERLGEKGATPIERVVKAARRLNAIDDEAVEEVAKN